MALSAPPRAGAGLIHRPSASPPERQAGTRRMCCRVFSRMASPEPSGAAGAIRRILGRATMKVIAVVTARRNDGLTSGLRCCRTVCENRADDRFSGLTGRRDRGDNGRSSPCRSVHPDRAAWEIRRRRPSGFITMGSAGTPPRIACPVQRERTAVPRALRLSMAATPMNRPPTLPRMLSAKVESTAFLVTP